MGAERWRGRRSPSAAWRRFHSACPGSRRRSSASRSPWQRFAAAAAHAVEGANPLPMTGYKAALLVGTVTEALERAAGVADPAGRLPSRAFRSRPPAVRCLTP